MHQFINVEEYSEFVVEFKDGTRDWIDPVDSYYEDDESVCVKGCFNNTYSYDKSKIDKWTIRPYTDQTTYDPIQ